MSKDNNISVSEFRKALSHKRRVVVKIGSRVLIQRSGRIDMRRISALVKELALLKHSGQEVIIVTSGAIGTGMEILGMKQRPSKLPDLQMAAAVGQNRLMTRYETLFSAERCIIGQVLLTHDDLKHRSRHLNARNTIMNMLKTGIIPVVNENDAVAVDEIKFGDNDLLASLVVHLIDADLLILLTTVDGLRETMPSGRSRRVPFIKAITKDVIRLAADKGSLFSTGGMASKLESARAVSRAGVCVVIADGRKPRIITRIMAGDDTGTLITPMAQKSFTRRKRWIAFFHKTNGVLVIDDGARRAIEKHGKSLLPIGVKKVEGTFYVGAAVDIQTLDQSIIARGLVGYSSHDIRLIQGHRTDEITEILGTDNYDEVIHRDNMVLLESTGENDEPA